MYGNKNMVDECECIFDTNYTNNLVYLSKNVLQDYSRYSYQINLLILTSSPGYTWNGILDDCLLRPSVRGSSWIVASAVRSLVYLFPEVLACLSPGFSFSHTDEIFSKQKHCSRQNGSSRPGLNTSITTV